MPTEKALQIRTLSSLAKVFPKRIYGKASHACMAARGQEVSFQVAYRVAAKHSGYRVYFNVSCEGMGATVSRVGYVPSLLTCYVKHPDDHYLTTEPGLFPDPLLPKENEPLLAMKDYWHAIWITVPIPLDATPGSYTVRLSFTDTKGNPLAKSSYTVHVHAITLPEQELIYTQWFHCDCIASAHRVPVLSKAHWQLIERYMQLAAHHGMNMILTPVLTPPLDTAVGGERPTVQLVGIERVGKSYRFDFSNLGRYVAMARACGISYFEINHFFTQWGVAHAPKVMARVEGKLKRIFGWETDAMAPEYVAFLQQLIPALIDYLHNLGIDDKHIYFHVSDEPHKTHLEAYRAAAAVLKPLIGTCGHMDALSDLSFYREGLLPTPVVVTDRIEPFLEEKIENLWCYYCCSEYRDVSNRFFVMPSARTRIIGVQMYRSGIKGFLQWGYNFYYTEHSRREIDPYAVTDGGEAFPSGDAFTVYPYGDGAIPSLRQKVFSNALEDMRLLQLAEQRIGRDAVIEALDRIAGCEITFKQYPHDEEFFDRLYRYLFEVISG